MGHVVTYPGPSAPGPTSVQIDAPEGWSASQPPGLDLMVRSDNPLESGFIPNIVVSQRRFPADTDPAVLENGVYSRVAAMPEFAPAFRSQVEIDGRSGFVLEYAFSKEPENVTIAQVQMNVLVQSEAFCDLVTLTGSAGPIDTADQVALLRSVLSTAQFVTADGSAT